MAITAISAALFLSALLPAADFGAGQPAQLQIQEGSSWSMSAIARAPARRTRSALESFRRPSLLGFLAAQAASTAAGDSERAASDDRQDCTDINTAEAKDLQKAKGIGPAKAEAIVDDRTANGPYAKLGDLERVKGVGPATVANIKEAGFCVK